MAWSLLANSGAGSSDANTVTVGPINTTNATLLVLIVADYAFPSIGAPNDTQTNTWNVSASVGTDGSNSRSAIFYATSVVTSATHSFTYPSSGVGYYPAMMVMAWSAVSPVVTVLNSASSGGGSVTTLQTGSITTAENGDLIIAGWNGNAAGSPGISINSGFTISDTVNGATSLCFSGSAAYLVQGTAAAINPTWSFNSQVAAASIIAFRATATASTQRLPALGVG